MDYQWMKKYMLFIFRKYHLQWDYLNDLFVNKKVDEGIEPPFPDLILNLYGLVKVLAFFHWTIPPKDLSYFII